MVPNNPTDPKVVVAGVVGGVAGAVVVLLMNLINKEPLNQTALETVLAGVVSGAFSFVAGYLKKTPVGVLNDRLYANKANEEAGD
jgi:H+/Cl- antiporter ClcA